MPFPLPSSRPLRSPEHRWTLRDGVAAAALFAASAAVVLWQNSHVAVLWDIAYTLDSAMRIVAGQMPYRDFPFVHPPLTFLIQAAIIRLTGRVFFHHVVYAAVVGGLGTVLTWRIALHTMRGRINHPWLIALLLSAPLAVLGLYSIIPHPSYDCDCAFSMLISIWLLRRLARSVEPNVDPNAAASQPVREIGIGLAAGVALCLPLFFKQNMGVPFLMAALGAVAFVLASKFIAHERPIRIRNAEMLPLWAVLAGAVATLAVAALLLHFTVGLGNYLHWTITFARERRLPPSGAMLQIYTDPNLLWTLPCIAAGLLLLKHETGNRRPGKKGRAHWKSTIAFALIAAPFVFALCSLLLYDDADERGDSLLTLWPMLLILATVFAAWNLLKTRRNLTLRALMPVILLAGIHGTFLSQQLWGSSYAIWPLLILLIAEMITFLTDIASGASTPAPDARSTPAWLPTALTSLIAAILLVCGAFYTSSEERLSYADLPDGPTMHSEFPQLAGLSLAGPYLLDFDELLHYAAAQIPFNDGLILLPGEDPFYFATGRVPQFPLLLFDPATDPYSPQQIAALAQARNIRWLIVKRNLQIKVSPMPQPEATLKLLENQFTLVTHLHGYDIYRRP